MKRLLLAMVLSLGFVGAAQAQMPGADAPFASNPQTQGQAFGSLGQQVFMNMVNSAPSAIPAILLEGASPLAAFSLPTVVDPFDPTFFPSYYNAVVFMQPLHQVIPPSMVETGSQILLGGDGPYVISGIMEYSGNSGMSMPSGGGASMPSFSGGASMVSGGGASLPGL